jgi:hypothetical protein
MTACATRLASCRSCRPRTASQAPGRQPIMAAFTHLNPVGDRFTDGSYGVFYAGLTLATAIDETRHHRTHFLQATDEPAQELDMRVYAVRPRREPSRHPQAARGVARTVPSEQLCRFARNRANLARCRVGRHRLTKVCAIPAASVPPFSGLGYCRTAAKNGISAMCGTVAQIRTVYEKRLLDS